MARDCGRRALLAGAASALLGALAGCFERVDAISVGGTPTPAPTPTATGTHGDFPRGSRTYPARPADNSEAAAVEFARTSERVRVTNSLDGPEATTVSAAAEAVHDRALLGGHLVVASGSGYANYEDGVHADWGQAPALYFVSPDLVVRTADHELRRPHCSEVYAAEDPSQNFAPACEGDDAGFRLSSLHPDPQTVSVTVEYVGEQVGNPETVLEATHDIGYHQGIALDGVTRRQGTHQITARLPDSEPIVHEWTPGPDSGAFGEPLTVLVTPGGTLRVRRPPLGEVY